MAILVVGSVAFDAIETPSGRRERCLGGAATHFSLAASYFTPVRVIGVVGEDFGPEEEAVFARRQIDTRGIEHVSGKSFFWS
ncbi:MAG: sugar kinase, partial [Acidobacteriaceae bacterium]